MCFDHSDFDSFCSPCAFKRCDSSRRTDRTIELCRVYVHAAINEHLTLHAARAHTRRLLSDSDSSSHYDIVGEQVKAAVMAGSIFATPFGAARLVQLGEMEKVHHKRTIKRRRKHRLRWELKLLKEKQVDLRGKFDNSQSYALKLERQIEKEELEMRDSAFQEGADDSQKLIVLLGKSGHGKSTFVNRLNGDETDDCSEPGCPAEFRWDSVTGKLSKNRVVFEQRPLTVVDTPGVDDSTGSDTKHMNSLCQFVRGCGGVNAFVLVIDGVAGGGRGDASIQSMLQNYRKWFGGDSFVERLLIVVSSIDDGSYKTKAFDKAGGVAQVQTQIGALLGAKKPIPTISMGFSREPEFYKSQLRQLIAATPKDKIEIRGIHSPLDGLKQDHKRACAKANSAGTQLREVDAQVRGIKVELEAIARHMAETDDKTLSSV